MGKTTKHTVGSAKGPRQRRPKENNTNIPDNHEEHENQLEEEEINVSEFKNGHMISTVNTWLKKPSIEHDLSGILLKYMKGINESGIHMQNGIFTISFAEAGLLLQSATLLYGKKVDIMYKSVMESQIRIIKASNDLDAVELEKLETRMRKRRPRKAIEAPPKQPTQTPNLNRPIFTNALQLFNSLLESGEKADPLLSCPQTGDLIYIPEAAILAQKENMAAAKVNPPSEPSPQKERNRLIKREDMFSADFIPEFKNVVYEDEEETITWNSLKMSKLDKLHQNFHWYDVVVLGVDPETIFNPEVYEYAAYAHEQEHMGVGMLKLFVNYKDYDCSKAEAQIRDHLSFVEAARLRRETLDQKTKRLCPRRSSIHITRLTDDILNKYLQDCSLSVNRKNTNSIVDELDNTENATNEDNATNKSNIPNDSNTSSNTNVMSRDNNVTDVNNPTLQLSITNSTEAESTEVAATVDVTSTSNLTAQTNSADAAVASTSNLTAQVDSAVASTSNLTAPVDSANNLTAAVESADADSEVASATNLTAAVDGADATLFRKPSVDSRSVIAKTPAGVSDMDSGFYSDIDPGHVIIGENQDQSIADDNAAMAVEKEQQEPVPKERKRRKEKTDEDDDTDKVPKVRKKHYKLEVTATCNSIDYERFFRENYNPEAREGEIVPLTVLSVDYERFFCENYVSEAGEGEVVPLPIIPEEENTTLVPLPIIPEQENTTQVPLPIIPEHEKTPEVTVEPETDHRDNESVHQDNDNDNTEEAVPEANLSLELTKTTPVETQLNQEETQEGQNNRESNLEDESNREMTEEELRLIEIGKQVKHIQEQNKEYNEWKQFVSGRVGKESDAQFDIHERGTNILNNFAEIGDVVNFDRIVENQDSKEVIRSFVAMLELANAMNVEIIDDKPGTLCNGRLELKLLSTERNYADLSEYVAPSEKERPAKIRQIKRNRQEAEQPRKKPKAKSFAESTPISTKRNSGPYVVLTPILPANEPDVDNPAYKSIKPKSNIKRASVQFNATVAKRSFTIAELDTDSEDGFADILPAKTNRKMSVSMRDSGFFSDLSEGTPQKKITVPYFHSTPGCSSECASSNRACVTSDIDSSSHLMVRQVDSSRARQLDFG